MSHRVRVWLIGVCPVLLIAGVLAFGLIRDGQSVSMAECEADPPRCAGVELYIGYARVKAVDDRTVTTKSWMGDLTFTPWPAEAPLPSLGMSVSVVGPYTGGRSVRPVAVEQHPLRRRKEVVGLVMLALWMGAGGVWVLRGWRRRA